MKLFTISFIALFTLSTSLAQPKISSKYSGNFNSTDGWNSWQIGVFPERNLVAYQNDFWSIISTDSKGLTIENRRTGSQQHILYSSLKQLSTSFVDDHSQAMPPEAHNRLSETSFHDGTALLRGLIDDYTPELGFSTIAFNTTNLATREDFTSVTKIAPDGTFEQVIDLAHPTMVNCQIGETYANIYLHPGDTILALMNYQEHMNARNSAKQSVASDRYMGTSALLCGEVNRFYDIIDMPTYMDIMELAGELAPDDYQDSLLTIMSDNAEKIEHFVLSHNVTTKGAKILRENNRFLMADQILSYNRRRQQLAYTKKDTTIKPVELPISYFDVVKQLPLNEPKIIALPMFDQFLQTLYFYTPIYRSQEVRFSPVDQIKRLNLLSSAHQQALDTVSPHRLVKYLTTNYPWALDWINTINDAKRISQQGKQFFDSLADFTTELFISRECSYVEDEKYYVDNRVMSQLLRYFTNPYYIKVRLDANDRLRPLTATAAPAKYTPVTQAEVILDSIVQPFRGKVLLVDFWASWCAPCRANMQEGYKLKNQLADLPVEFVYIANSNPTTTEVANKFFNENNIVGHHFEISSDQWNILSAQWNIQSVPRYMIINKQGAIVAPKVNWHSIVEMLRQAAK